MATKKAAKKKAPAPKKRARIRILNPRTIKREYFVLEAPTAEEFARKLNELRAQAQSPWGPGVTKGARGTDYNVGGGYCDGGLAFSAPANVYAVIVERVEWER